MLKAIPPLTGKIKLSIGKKNYFSIGDVIKCHVRLELKEDIKARGVKIRLVGEELNRGVEYSWSEIYKKEIVLDKRKEYKKGVYEYDFEFKIPEEISEVIIRKPIWIGSIQIVPKAIRMMKWKLVALLDVPRNIDISAKRDLVIE